MRSLGVHGLDVTCRTAAMRRASTSIPIPMTLLVLAFGPRMACTSCGIIGADARPNWREQPGCRSNKSREPVES
jgi:hypothetical protein